VTGFFEVMLQLLLRVPPTLPDGPYLLRGRRSVRVLVRATVAGATSGIGVHKGIVPPGVLLRKRRPHALPSRRQTNVNRGEIIEEISLKSCPYDNAGT
jgi:hypothetical protein